MRSHDNKYRISLIISVLADIVLCAALLVSLIYYWHNGRAFSTHYLVGFSAFFVLFTGFLVSLLVAVHTKKISAILVTVVFTVARFICAIVVVIAWLSEYGGQKNDTNVKVDEDVDPYQWIANRKAILIAFAGIYIKIFFTQMIILNRYYSHASEDQQRNYEIRMVKPEPI